MGGPLGRLREGVGRLIFRQVYERPLLPRFNDVRAELGLEPLHTIAELLERVDRALVLTSPAFDFPSRLPANVEYVGPQLDPVAASPAWDSPWPRGDDRPLVVVGLSTTHQGHDSMLERIVGALATLPVRALVTTGGAALRSTPPANVHVARFVPHGQVLPEAAVVVTHAGLGTVHAALAHGLPLVCLPMGRDQPDNAARVEWHGAGLRLSSKSSSATIGAAVERVLVDPASRPRPGVSRPRSRRSIRQRGRQARSRPWLPMGRHDADVHRAIEDDLRAAGFTEIELETIALPSRSNARDATNGMGSAPPFRAEIERRDPAALERAA
ncbi:MAG: nucleotide disphospho-sugar-binding domain-containing protein, partial [Candidatus Limnocylindrales bacterium]